MRGLWIVGWLVLIPGAWANEAVTLPAPADMDQTGLVHELRQQVPTLAALASNDAERTVTILKADGQGAFTDAEVTALKTVIATHNPKPYRDQRQKQKDEEPVDIPVGSLGGVVGGALAGAGVTFLRGRKQKEAPNG